MSTLPPRHHAGHIPTRAFSHQTGLSLGAAQTLGVLRPLHRRGHVLGLVDDAIVPCGSDVDLVLTSYGPVATHSVWHEHGLPGPEISELAAEARDNARLAGELLEAVGLGVAVLPVVVVWGPDETLVPSTGRVRHDVTFLRGGELKSWLKGSLKGSLNGHVDRDEAFTSADADNLMVRLRAYRTATRP